MTIIHLDQYRIEAEKLKMIEKILQMSPKCYLEVVIFKRFILIERLFILYLNTREKQKFVLDEIWIRDSSYSELVIVAFASHCHYFWNHPIVNVYILMVTYVKNCQEDKLSSLIVLRREVFNPFLPL